MIDPDVNDLRWEIVRRNQKYISDYQENPTWRAGMKWGLRVMEDPALSWEETTVDINGKTFHVSPVGASKAAKLTISMKFGFKDHDTELKKPDGKKYVWFQVDPWANLEDLKRSFGTLIKLHRHGKNPPKDQIKTRIGWLELVDEIEKKNPLPSRKTFASLFKTPNLIKRKRDTFTKGCLLIEDPLEDPLRKISSEEIREYQIKHGLLTPRK